VEGEREGKEVGKVGLLLGMIKPVTVGLVVGDCDGLTVGVEEGTSEGRGVVGLKEG
jgi:hypothetical protein